MQFPFRVTGTVVGGEQVARRFGFPTANIDFGDRLDIAEGVYVGYARIGKQSERIAALIFYGKPYALPHITTPRFEVHLLVGTHDLYGKTLEIEIVEFVRPNKKFDDPIELAKAIEHDAQVACQYFRIPYIPYSRE